MNFAIVGCGAIALQHIETITELPGAKLSALYSRNTDKANEWGQKYQVKSYSDYDRLLADESIDVVVILTPSGTHAEFGIRAAQAKKHVIVEKPIDITLEKANALITACGDAGVLLSCIFQHRFDDAVLKLKEAVEEGRLGQLNLGVSRTTWYRPQTYYDSAEWRGTRALDGGGALMNQSIHYIDLLIYIMGPVEEVFAYCARRAHERIDVEDIAAAAVKFKSGAVGLIEGTTAAFPGFNTALDIFGEKGSVRIDSDQIAGWHIQDMEEEAVSAGRNAEKEAQFAETALSFMRQYEDITQAIAGGTEPLVNGKEAAKSLELILAIYKSAETGRPVQLN
ncbi:Gfo/Idh/MocA family oxidoreductase [Planomicrobium sp. CPCC 101110]|nr:Gfo/Idh/MocA family oxidoreductase [Planomicrobium sp. CPCC 101110]